MQLILFEIFLAFYKTFGVQLSLEPFSPEKIGKKFKLIEDT